MAYTPNTVGAKLWEECTKRRVAGDRWSRDGPEKGRLSGLLLTNFKYSLAS
jgi:hypothetical protein